MRVLISLGEASSKCRISEAGLPTQGTLGNRSTLFCDNPNSFTFKNASTYVRALGYDFRNMLHIIAHKYVALAWVKQF